MTSTSWIEVWRNIPEGWNEREEEAVYSKLSGKSRGRRLVAYINKHWCTNCSLVRSHCSKSVEYLMLICWPSYMLWEFTVVFIVTVYIPPRGLSGSYERHNKHPEAFWVVVGDFNHAKLTDILPRFRRLISVATRGNNTIDQVHTNRWEHTEWCPAPVLAYLTTVPLCWFLGLGHTASKCVFNAFNWGILIYIIENEVKNINQSHTFA